MKIRFAQLSNGVVQYVLTPTTAQDGFQLGSFYRKDCPYSALEPDGISVRLFLLADPMPLLTEAKRTYQHSKFQGLSKEEVDAILPPIQEIQRRNAAAEAQAAAQGQSDADAAGG